VNTGDSKQRKLLWGSVAVVALVVIATLIDKGSIGLQLILSGLTVGSIYALVAMGFSIIYSSTRVINFAQGGFSMLGGMLMYSLAVSGKLPMWLAFILAVLIVTALGAGFERVVIRPMKDHSVITVIIVTIGLSIFMTAVPSGYGELTRSRSPRSRATSRSDYLVRLLSPRVSGSSASRWSRLRSSSSSSTVRCSAKA